MRGKVVAVVAAAGSGKRLGLKTKKPFVMLAGKPIIVRTIESLSASDLVDSVIVAIEEPCIPRFMRLASAHRLRKVSAVVTGGATRAQSVKNCLSRLDEGCEIVLIHDGGRPLVDKRIIADAVKAARRYGACIAAVPESDTVKSAGKDLVIRKTLDRKCIFRAQTPQAFRVPVIRKAYERAGSAVTDDASAVEISGGKVRIIMGSYRNIKITAREDLKVAEALI